MNDKELLLKDLCARLSYGVKVHAKYVDTDTNTEVEKVGVLSMIDNDKVVAFTCDDTNCYIYVAIHEVKPYLFPLSSMTEEQRDDYYATVRPAIYECLSEHRANKELYDGELPITLKDTKVDILSCEWMLKNHFDYMGLIPRGLAIDCTNLNVY